MTTKPQIYSSDQQAYCLSLLSNIGSRLDPPIIWNTSQRISQTVKTAIKTILSDDNVKDLIGSWELVWGPKVVIDAYSGFKKKPVNTMFIARLAGTPSQFVVAIAGTNFKSIFDWVMEDFWVRNKVDWPFIPENFHKIPVPQISNGTYYGLNNLLNMYSGGQTAQDYLSEHAASEPDTVVTVTGHSLGGALSPCYALYLLDTQSNWDKQGNVTIKCLPTAGATPGDRAFAEYFNKSLGERTNRIWNKLDIVPHAWEQDMLAQILTIYEDGGIATPNSIKIIIERLMHKTKKNHYTQILADTEGIPSKVVKDPPNQSLEEFSKKHPFLGEALYQHTERYTEIFKVEDFSKILKDILKQLGITDADSSLKSIYISDEELTSVAEFLAMQADLPE